MEKDKGLLSFRKHPVGNVLDEKKGRKRKGGRLRRSMGFLMAAALIFSTLPVSGLVVSASEQEKGLCEHHRSHTAECGYEEAQPCTYECRICPIEALIAALPEQVTEDNAEEVRAQLDEILALYRELDEDEQGQIDLSRIYALQEALDNANAPVQAAEEITINNATVKTLTAEDGDCPGHTFTGTAQRTTIYVESGAHDVTFSGLNISEATVGIAPGATMNLTIEGTNTIKSDYYAGIYVPENAALVITAESTGTLDVSSSADAGIGGGAYDPSDPDGSTSGNPNCGTVEINGGTVTATGGSNSSGYYGGAGIGGSAGASDSDPAGNGGTLTINGGTVNLTAGNSTSYGFGQGTGKAPGGTCELTLADASCLTLAEGTTLDPKGKYTINGDPTEDMIVVPELVYTGQALDLTGKIYIDDTKTGTGTYFNQTFTVNANADGWILQDLGEVVEAGEYTATFTKGDKSISKTFTVAQSGTDLTDGKVKTYKDGAECSDFTAGDTITVKATPTATGAAPTTAAMLTASLDAPSEGQMAVFVGNTQVSVPADKGEDGSYTMEVSAADVLTLGGVEPNGDPITLTAKFEENDNMADAAGTVEVSITAAAKAEQDGAVIGYYGESNLDKAFANDGATVTLLDNITTSTHIGADTGNLTLDLNGKTITKPASYGVYVSGSGHLTIRGNGNIISTGTSGHYPEAITSLGGTLTLESGTFIGIMYGVRVDYETSVLSVTGENVSIQGEKYGLHVVQAQSVQLSAGTYSSISVYTFNTLASLLAENCAYYKGSTPVLLSELEGKTELTGPVTVKVCDHTGDGVCEYMPNENDASTHTKTCLACGYTETGDCGFEKTADPTADSHTGQCPDCKRDRSGAHSFSDWAGNPVARTCTVCGYEQTAVARVVKDSTTTYVGALANAFTEGNSGATVTLLSEVDLGSNYIGIRGSSTFTLDLNGQTVKASHYGAFDISGGSLTIQDSGTGGKIESSNITIKVTGGTLSIKSGTVSGFYGVQITSGTVNISGGVISGTENGLWVNGGGNIVLSGGAYSGIHAILVDANVSVTLKDLLAARYAYHQNDIPVAKAEGWVDNDNIGEVPLDTKPAWLTGTVTVKECNHTGGLVPSENGYQHGGPCQCCGAELTAANHTLGADNQCSGCGAELVAKVEKSSSDTVYVAANGLNAAFAEDSGNAGATFTLLSDVEPNTCLDIQIDCTLDLGGHTITSPTGRSQCVNVQTNATVTIRGEGGITAPSGIALAVNGSVTLEGGTYTGGGNESSSVYVVGQSAMLSVTGEKVSIRNTGGGYGLIVAPAQSVQLSAGTYSGTAGAISSTLNFSDMLAHTENIRYAYYQGDALVTTGLDGQALTGTVTVKACTHAYQYAHTTGATTHSQTCPACGDAKAAETCSYDAATGRCACGSTLAVTLPADLAFTYDGTAKTPAVTVTVDGTPLTEGYSVAYNNNINAGNAAAVIITGTSFTGTVTLTFSIGKATPTIAWSSTSQELTYTGQQAVIIAPTVTLENNENFGGTISYSYKKQGETDYKDGLPTDAGTYTIKAHVDAEGNYAAADSTNELTLVIQKADAAITVGTDTYHKTFGDAAFTLDVTDNNTEADVQYEVTEGADVVSVEDGTVTILNAGTAEIRVSLPASANYNAAENKTITVTVDKKSGYTVAVLNRSYYYQDGKTDSIELAALLPKDCGNVTYGEPAVSGNVTYSAAPAVSGGKLSYTLDSGNIDDAGTITVTVVTRNFEDITVTVAITRSACDHEAGEILYTGAGERAPVCTEDGLGHRECTKCGSVVESGIVVEALGHTGGTATCSQRKVCTRCGQPYGDTDDSVHDWHITSEKAATAASEGKRVYTCSGCGKIYEESIPKLPQPTHTHSYGTDWKSDSNSHWHECFCGEKAHIAAHTEDGGSVTKPATETETGIRTYKCSVCGYVMRTEVIDKLSSTGSQTETPQEPVTSEQIRKNSEKLDSGIVINVDGNKFNLSWKKVSGAEGYDIFAAPYGKTKLDAKSLIKSVKGNKTSASLAKIDGKKVYQVQIKAWRYVDGKKVYIGSSRVYHVAGKANTKYTNAKKLQPAKEKYALKKGMSIRIKVTVIKQSKKKLLPKSNGSALCYESSNKEIATVTSNGKVKAKKKGTCYITVTALNGVKTKIKIMVK